MAISEVIDSERGLVVDLGSLETENVVRLFLFDEEPNTEEAKKESEAILAEVAIAETKQKQKMEETKESYLFQFNRQRVSED